MNPFSQDCKALALAFLTMFVSGCNPGGGEKPLTGITVPLGNANAWRDTAVTKATPAGQKITIQIRKGIASVLAPTEFWRSWTVALSVVDPAPNPIPPTAPAPDGSDVLDSDGDGVPDPLDQCPATAAGEPVDPNGCSLDDKFKGPDSIWNQRGRESLFATAVLMSDRRKISIVFMGKGTVPHP